MWWETIVAYNHPRLYHVQLLLVYGIDDEGAAERHFTELEALFSRALRPHGEG